MAIGQRLQVRAYRFGSYELDPAGELRKFGTRIKLQNKPFYLLLALVERPGEIVTRSELQEKLWPGTFVDFERNLNIAVKKVRDALCDEANQPKFIETIPGQGYRFIRRVELVSPATVVPEAPEHSSEPARTDHGMQFQVRRWVAVGAMGIVVAALLGTYWWHSLHLLNFTPRGWVLIAQFENRTGEPLLDGSLEAELARELSYSRTVNVAPPERVYDALRLMKRPPQYPVDAATAREVCVRDGGIQALLSGRVAKIGSTYEITVFVENPQTGATVDSFEREASGAQQLVPVMHLLSNKVRERLGEDVAAVKASDAELLKVTSPSLEAVQLYSRADAALRRNANTEAEQLLKRALERDPNFASAWNLLGWVERRLGNREENLADSEKAFQLASTVSDREAYFIRGSYYHHREDYANAVGNYEALLNLYPDDWWGNNNLWFIYLNVGREKDALRLREHTADIRPTLVGETFSAWMLYEDVDDRPRSDKYLTRLQRLVAGGAPIGLFGRVRLEWIPVFQKINHDDWGGAISEMQHIDQSLQNVPGITDNLRGPEANVYIAVGNLTAAAAAVDKIAVPKDRTWFQAEIAAEKNDVPALRRALDAFAAQPISDDPGLMWHLAWRFDLPEQRKKLGDIFLKTTAFQTVAKRWNDGLTALTENRSSDAIKLLTDVVNHFSVLRYDYYFFATEDLADAYEKTGDFSDAIRVLEPLERDHRMEINQIIAPTYARYRLWQLYGKTGRTSDAAKLEGELREIARYADPDHPYLAQFRPQ